MGCGYEDKLEMFINGELPPAEAARTAAHVETCEDCAEAVSRMRLANDAAKAAASALLPGDEYFSSLAEKLRQRRAEAPAHLPRKAFLSRERLLWGAVEAIAAAMLIIAVGSYSALKSIEPGGPGGSTVIIAPAPGKAAMHEKSPVKLLEERNRSLEKPGL